MLASEASLCDSKIGEAHPQLQPRSLAMSQKSLRAARRRAGGRRDTASSGRPAQRALWEKTVFIWAGDTQRPTNKHP